MVVDRIREKMTEVYQYFDELVQPKRKNMSFMKFYSKLQECFLTLSDNTGRDEIRRVVDKIFSPEEDANNAVWHQKQKSTYNHCENLFSMETYFPLSFTRKRDTVYRNYFGYAPRSEQLPRYIDFAKTYAMMQPPPNMENVSLWKALVDKPPTESNNIVVNTVVHGRAASREYRVFSPQSLKQFCSGHDFGAGEVFSSQLWCCGLTFDIDGKTFDAKQHGWGQVYPIKEIETELLSVLREDMMSRTNRRWDARKVPPAIHTWTPENRLEQKLSLRISIHLPPNVCFQTIDDVSECVKSMCLLLVKRKSRYLTVKYITVDDGQRFEKSHMGYNNWISLSSDGKSIDLIQYLKDHQKSVITLEKSKIEVTRSADGSFCVTHGDGMRSVYNLSSWIGTTLDGQAMVDCLLDEKIYHNNRSLRLPQQSKWLNGKPVRKLEPTRENSSILDALIHFPHCDTPMIPGEPLLLSCRSKLRDCLPIAMPSSHLDVERAKSAIDSRYHMTVTKVTWLGGVAFMDVETKNPSPCNGSGNFCLIKGDWHRSARMFFVLNQKGELTINCWSSNCKKKAHQESFCT